MLAVIYRRVSTEEQASKGYSLETQWESCRNLALACGATELADCADEGVPGDVLNRPGLTTARELIKTGRVAFFVVYDPDRLARKLTHQLIVTEEIERSGARLEFVNFEWKATPEGRLFYSLRGAIAEYEKAKIAERTGRGRLAKAKRGLLPVASPAYGYRYVDSRLQVNPEEALWVQAIYRWAEENLGLLAIAQRLSDLAVPPRRSRKWHAQTIRGILANPTYTGVFYANRYDTHGMVHNRFAAPGEKARYRLRPAQEWIPIEVPALIAPVQWERVQRLREKARRKWSGARAAGDRYLVRGLVQCGAPGCGQGMRGYCSRGRLYYQCGSKWSGAPCSMRLAKVREVDAAVWERVRTWLTHPLVGAAEPGPGPAPDTGESARLIEQVRGLDREEETILHLARKGLTGLEATERELGELHRRRERIHQRIAELRNVPPVQNPPAPLLPHLDALSFADRVALTRRLVARVVCTTDAVRIEARIPAALLV